MLMLIYQIYQAPMSISRVFCRHSLIHNYVHVAAITCLFYDHLVTFDAEVTYIWGRPKSIGVYSFLVNRYFAIVANIIIVIPGIGENAHSEQVRYL